MRPLSVGARGRRFVLEMPVETPDGFGGVLRSYVAGPQLWGAIELLRGSERFVAARAEQAVTHRVTLRYREGVSGGMRLVRGLRRFAIRSASDPDGTRKRLVCLVEEIAP